jgi:predicted nucleotidyltransferase
VLTHTFVDPNRELHLREVARLAGLAPRSAQQEVDRLVGAGYLLERRSGNRRYLRANKGHPLFRPVREIVLKTTGLADVLRRALGAQGIEWALVFGSFASNEPTAGSDVDLLLVGSLGLREAVRRLGKAQQVLGREVNPVVWSEREYQKRLREGDPFLKRIMAGSTIPIIGASPLLP